RLEEQGVAQVGRLHRDQPYRGAGRDRRQHRPLRGPEQPRGHGAADEPGGGAGDRPADPAARPRRHHRHRPDRHDRAGAPRGGLRGPRRRAAERPGQDQGAQHLRVRPGGGHPQAEPGQPGAAPDPALPLLLGPRPHPVGGHDLPQPAQGAPPPAGADGPVRDPPAGQPRDRPRPAAGGARHPRRARTHARRAHPPPERPRDAPRALRRGRSVNTERFSIPGWTGELDADLRPIDLEGEVRRLTDPAAAVKTLHWGRNYLYVARMETVQGPVDVVVKQFRNQGVRARLKRKWKGSKAARSWKVARALLDAGLLTPAPVMRIESTAEEGPSFYVCRLLEGTTEARYLLRAANAGEPFPRILLPELGKLARRLHEA